MKSSTSRSVLPSRSSSRMRFFRSTASAACESARVWFWHTRQRSSSASVMTRFSSKGSSTTGEAEMARELARMRQTRKAKLRTLQLLHERQDAIAHDIGREDADALVADHALLVDDEGFRHAIDAVIHAEPAVAVVKRQGEGVAEARQPGEGLAALVLVVEAHDRRGAAAREGSERRMLLAA